MASCCAAVGGIPGPSSSTVRGHHPRRPHVRLRACALCGDLFDLRKETTEARGRYCSTTCLVAARLAHRRHIELTSTASVREVPTSSTTVTLG